MRTKLTLAHDYVQALTAQAYINGRDEMANELRDAHAADCRTAHAAGVVSGRAAAFAEAVRECRKNIPKARRDAWDAGGSTARVDQSSALVLADRIAALAAQRGVSRDEQSACGHEENSNTRKSNG